MIKKIFLEPVEKIIFLAAIFLTAITIFIAIYIASDVLIIISVLLTVSVLVLQRVISSESWYFRKAVIHEKIVRNSDWLSHSIKALAFRLLSDKRNKYYWLSCLKIRNVSVIAASDPSAIKNSDYMPDEFMIVAGHRPEMPKGDLRVHIGSSQCMQPYFMNVIHFRNSSFYFQLEANNHDSHHTFDKNDIVLEIKSNGPFMLNERFNEKLFLQNAMKPGVKMIEIDLSLMITGFFNEGNRVDCIRDLLSFVWKIRRITMGKPVGIKLSKYNRGCLSDLCSEINKSITIPDFITLSAEFYKSFQVHPANEGKDQDDFYVSASKILRMHKLDEEVKIIAEGTVESGFDLYKSFALGISAWFLNSGVYFKPMNAKHVISDKYEVREELLNGCFEFMKLGGYTETWQVEPYSIYKKDIRGKYSSLYDLYFQKAGGLSFASIKHFNLN
ncbi:hypothetical protein MYP_1153 [Sporocytophaga myxococcoides]|uniref:Uncharacterized protein n=1 Tax=Sporocytophaga myxococcoides TaxID=153721 RepID=A0A098LAJ2_9BACT|nr:hypothetical protein [Sporocytophaga myxococcoides]GAL83925.1 hypothetical protein MYP_1153 [Sporocytophaga myxococcoides]